MEKKKINNLLLLKYSCFFILFLILAQAEINFCINPFVFGLLFSLVWCDQNIYLCSAFYFAVNLLFSPFSLGLILSCAFTIAVLFFFYFLHKKIKKPINRYLYLVYAFLSQIAFLYFSYITPETLVNGIISVLIGLIYLYCINKFFSSVFIKGITNFTIDELFCAGVFLISLCVGVSAINIYKIELIKIFVVCLLLLTTYILDTKSTFVVAVCAGIGYALNTNNIMYVAVFSLFSLFIIAFKGKYKYLSCIAVCLIEVFIGLYLKIYGIYTIFNFLSVFLGCLIFLVVPNQTINTLKNIFGEFNSNLVYRNLILSTKQGISKRLNEISEVFSEMELTFKNMVKGRLPEIEAKQMLLNEVISKVCSDCKEKHRCLRILNEETTRAFNDLLDRGFEKGKITLLDIPPILSTRCFKSATIISTINALLNSYKQYSNLISTEETSKVLIGEQMGGVSKLLRTLVNETSANFNFDYSKENEIKEELKFLHILCTEVIIYVKDSSNINVNIVIKKSEVNYHEIEKIISKILKIDMQIYKTEQVNNYFEMLSLKIAPKLDCIFGMSAVTKHNSEVSGDTYSFIKIDDDKVLMAISDGMGSGEEALRTSELSLNLIENFYRAGYDNEIILNSVNKLLTLTNEEIFSALDICVLDLTRQIIDFIKLGAPSCFIKLENEVEVVESASLPLGILEEISPSITKKVISGGELIILVSDGVIDSFKGEENLKGFIESLNILNPQSVAEEIIKVCKNQDEIVDDCTCLVLRVFNI